MEKCNICGSLNLSLLYRSQDMTISSVSSQFESQLVVKFCNDCAHTITEPPANMKQFYASDYNISLSSEDEDQLISINGADTIYRTELQARILKGAVDLSKCNKIIDYGGAKSATLKRIIGEFKNLDPYIFDVSDNYAKYWDGLFPERNRAIFDIPQSWNRLFDLATSFFVLEHVEHLDEALDNVKRILKVGGHYFIIVPNVFANIADFVVADHINHFSQISLEYFFNKHGFEIESLDDNINPSWYIVLAKNTGAKVSVKKADTKVIFDKITSIANKWANLDSRITQIKNGLKGKESVAIYGAGFYGSYIAKLVGLENFNCFIDKNLFIQQKPHFSKSVLDPSKLPEQVTDIVVALNPDVAVNAMNSIESWKGKNINFHYPLQA